MSRNPTTIGDRQWKPEVNHMKTENQIRIRRCRAEDAEAVHEAVSESVGEKAGAYYIL
jgi:hypothetical protein